MKRFKAFVIVGDQHGGCDGIEHEGRKWLVPYWLNTPDGEWQKPERIVPLDRFRHQTSKLVGFDFVVTEPIPNAVLSGPISPQLATQYGVVLEPDITLRRPKLGNTAQYASVNSSARVALDRFADSSTAATGRICPPGDGRKDGPIHATQPARSNVPPRRRSQPTIPP
jgi:hypothetical protein